MSWACVNIGKILCIHFQFSSVDLALDDKNATITAQDKRGLDIGGRKIADRILSA